MRTNVVGTATMLSASRDFGQPINVSTDEGTENCRGEILKNVKALEVPGQGMNRGGL